MAILSKHSFSFSATQREFTCVILYFCLVQFVIARVWKRKSEREGESVCYLCLFFLYNMLILIVQMPAAKSNQFMPINFWIFFKMMSGADRILSYLLFFEFRTSLLSHSSTISESSKWPLIFISRISCSFSFMLTFVEMI